MTHAARGFAPPLALPRPPGACLALACALLLAFPFVLDAAPGLLFREKMVGRMTWGSADTRDRGEGQRVALNLVISTEDADAFFADPRHAMTLAGTIDVTDPDGTILRYPIEEGRFEFMAPGASEDERVMTYALSFESWEGRRFAFRGIKTLRNDEGLDLPADTTALASTVHRGGPDGPVVAAGTLHFRFLSPKTVLRFVSSFRVPGARNLLERLRVLRRFARLYLDGLRATHGKKRRRRRWRWRR